MNILFEEEAELYIWDPEQESFRHNGIVKARITQRKDEDYVYWLMGSNDTGLLLAHRISSNMNQRLSSKMRSLTWNHLGDNGSQSSWLLRFETDEAFANALEVFTQCMWQTHHLVPWSKAKVCFFCFLSTEFNI